MIEITDSTFLEKWNKLTNARFVTSSPRRVDMLSNDVLTKSESNLKAARDLANEPHETLLHLPEGQINLHTGGIILLTKDPNFPIKFYCAWLHCFFKKKSAIQTKQLWCDKEFRKIRIGGLPLGAYCLFKVLLPKYKIVIGADEHTPDGERHAKSQVKYALNNGIYVYAIDENYQIYDITNHEIVEKNADAFWGVDSKYQKRLLIYSEENLFPKE